MILYEVEWGELLLLCYQLFLLIKKVKERYLKIKIDTNLRYTLSIELLHLVAKLWTRGCRLGPLLHQDNWDWCLDLSCLKYFLLETFSCCRRHEWTVRYENLLISLRLMKYWRDFIADQAVNPSKDNLPPHVTDSDCNLMMLDINFNLSSAQYFQSDSKM